MLLNNANENECALNLIGNLLMTVKGMLLTSVNTWVMLCIKKH